MGGSCKLIGNKSDICRFYKEEVFSGGKFEIYKDYTWKKDINTSILDHRSKSKDLAIKVYKMLQNGQIDLTQVKTNLQNAEAEPSNANEYKIS